MEMETETGNQGFADLEEMETEAKLNSIVRLARGFDKQGQVLGRVELQAACSEHERRTKIWNDAVLKKDYPFRQLSLYNGTKEIARCGIFFDFTIHESLHELDVKPGLQIRGIGRANVDDDVLLGFYPLEAFSHDGDEKTLALSNGYTVGLRVRKSEGTKYWIIFRCIESEVFAAELEDIGSDIHIGEPIADSNATDGANNDDASLGFIPSDRVISDAVGPILTSSSNRWRFIALCAMFLVVVGLPLSFVYGFRFRPDDNEAENQQKSGELLTLNYNPHNGSEPAYGSALSKETLRTQDSALRATKQELANQQQQNMLLRARIRQVQAKELLLRNAKKNLEDALRLERMRALVVDQREPYGWGTHDSTPYRINFEMIRYRLNAEKSFGDESQQIRTRLLRREPTWRYRVSVPYQPSSAASEAIFVGSSEEFKNKLLQMSYLSVKPVGADSQAAAFRVIWNITKRNGEIVEIQATVIHGDEIYKEFEFPRSPNPVMNIDGSDSSYQKFLATAIAEVYGYINPAWKKQFDATPRSYLPEDAGEQKRAVMPRSEENREPKEEKRGKGHSAE